MLTSEIILNCDNTHTLAINGQSDKAGRHEIHYNIIVENAFPFSAVNMRRFKNIFEKAIDTETGDKIAQILITLFSSRNLNKLQQKQLHHNIEYFCNIGVEELPF